MDTKPYLTVMSDSAYNKGKENSATNKILDLLIKIMTLGSRIFIELEEWKGVADSNYNT